MKRLAIIVTAIVCTACSYSWTEKEASIIGDQGEVMRVLTVDSEKDLEVLRKPCKDLKPIDLKSAVYKALERKMIATVTSPDQDGVGIAGPQVGISRRVVAVQRFDKPGDPFEVYPNIRITRTRGECLPGREGCLSVPDRRGSVLRYQDITIAYTSPTTLRDTTEDIKGFVAVIFQHETDHLDGVLYIDKIINGDEAAD